MNKLVVLSGVPGSGKSYFSNKIRELKKDHLYVISSDYLRALVGGSQSNLNNEKLVWDIFYSLAKTFALDKNGMVILDATHVNRKLRVDYNIEIAKLFDEVDLVMWDIPKDVALKQNEERDYPIPLDGMEDFFNKFELPNEIDENFFDHIIIIKNKDISPAIKMLGL